MATGDIRDHRVRLLSGNVQFLHFRLRNDSSRIATIPDSYQM